MKDWTAIFRAGRHTDSAGVTRVYTLGDLDKIVSAYDPEHHEAPLVIGHPKTDGPAYGWVKALKRQGDVVLAKFRDVSEGLKQAVRAGHFKKISVGLYADGGLRHVGILGAMPPAIKGLGSVSFGDGDDWREIEFSEPEKEGAEDMEKAELQKENAELKAKLEAEEKARKDAEADAKAKTEEAEKEKAEKEKAAAEYAEAQGKVMAKDREAKFEKLVKAGKLMPADKESVLGLAGLFGEAQTIEYAEGDKKTQAPAEAVFWKILESRPDDNPLLSEFAEEPEGDGDDKGFEDVDFAGKF